MKSIVVMCVALFAAGCGNDTEDDRLGGPAPASYSDIAGDDVDSPLKIGSVERRMDQGASAILATFRGQRLAWKGVVVNQLSRRLIVGVRTLRVVMPLQDALADFEKGGRITVEGIVDRVEGPARTVHLAADK